MQSEGVKKNQSIAKAFVILEAMVEAREALRLQDLSKMVGMPGSTVLRFLNTMIDHGYVTQNEESGRYGLTLKLAGLGSKVQANFPYRRMIHPYLDEISRRLREPVSLSVEQDRSVVYIDIVDGPDHMLRTLQRIGKVAPMHSTGAGKVLLLNHSGAFLDSYVKDKGLPSFTSKTITDIEALRQELENVKTRGFAYDDEECEIGVKCISFPVKDFRGKSIAAVSVTVPTTRLTAAREEEIVDVLRDVSTKASRELGFLS